jgi:hypothetical protein
VSSKWPVSMDSGRDVKEMYVTMRTGPTSGQTGCFVCHSWLCPTPEEEAEQGGQVNRAVGKKSVSILPNASHCFVVLLRLLSVCPLTYFLVIIKVLEWKRIKIFFYKLNTNGQLLFCRADSFALSGSFSILFSYWIVQVRKWKRLPFLFSKW